jgi:hypothetical protein
MNYEDEEFLQKIILIQIVAGGRSRTLNIGLIDPSSYPLDHEVVLDRIISELPDELWGRGILPENILSPIPCRV